MATAKPTYEQQIIAAARPAGLAYVMFFLLGALAINTFYLVFEQEERRFFLWGALALGFITSFYLPPRLRAWAHRFIDLGSLITLVWFVSIIIVPENLIRFGNFLGQMVCIFLVLFGFRTFRQNDFAWLMVISLVIMLLCSIPIYAASYIYSIFGFVLLLSMGLVVLNLYPGEADHRPEDSPLDLKEWSSQFGRTTGVSILIFIITGAIFAGLPQQGPDKDRQREGVRQIFGVDSLSAETRGSMPGADIDNADGTGAGSNYTGFSESFDIAHGRSGTIQEDTTPVLEVKAPGQPYMRAICWDTYTGRSWTRTEDTATRTALNTQPNPNYDSSRPQTNIFRLPTIDSPTIEERLKNHTMFTAEIKLVGPASTGKGFLFTPWRTVEVEGLFEGIFVDDTGTLNIDTQLPDNQPDTDRWVLSRGDSWKATYIPASEARTFGTLYSLTLEEVARYTVLPDLVSTRVKTTAIDVASRGKSNWEKAIAIQSYLQSHKKYTLSPPVLATSDDDAVHTWLFESEEGGHCEFFATAGAVMLRAAGVPTRVVTGFMPGTYNVVKGAWIIRGKDAHAWCEVFVPEQGWVPWDPTPASWGEDFVDGMSEITARVSRSLEQYFIYDPRGFWEHDFPRHLVNWRNGLVKTSRGVFRWGSQPGGLGIPQGIVYLVPLLIFGWAGSLWIGFRRHGVPWGDFTGLSRARTSNWSWKQYHRMLRRLRRQDAELPDGLTLGELAERVAQEHPRTAEALDELAEPFHHFHYEPAPKQPQWQQAVRRGWARVRRRL